MREAAKMVIGRWLKFDGRHLFWRPRRRIIIFGAPRILSNVGRVGVDDEGLYDWMIVFVGICLMVVDARHVFFQSLRLDTMVVGWDGVDDGLQFQPGLGLFECAHLNLNLRLSLSFRLSLFWASDCLWASGCFESQAVNVFEPQAIFTLSPRLSLSLRIYLFWASGYFEPQAVFSTTLSVVWSQHINHFSL